MVNKVYVSSLLQFQIQHSERELILMTTANSMLLSFPKSFVLFAKSFLLMICSDMVTRCGTYIPPI